MNYKQIVSAPWFPAVAPFLTYILFTTLEGWLPKSFFVALYTLKVIATAVVIGLTWKHAHRQGRFYGETPRLQDYGIAIALGIVLGLTWIPIDHFTPHFAFLGSRDAFNPFERIANPVVRAAFFVVRIFGGVLIVPYVEELFYRSLLLRAVTHPENWNLSVVGKFNNQALAVNIGFFALSHPEWLAAAVFAAAMCWLTRSSRGVVTPMVAHGVTNLVLGIVVVYTGSWGYW